jgi:hypothetical protein
LPIESISAIDDSDGVVNTLKNLREFGVVTHKLEKERKASGRASLTLGKPSNPHFSPGFVARAAKGRQMLGFLRIGNAIERRRRERSIAWGVSPRTGTFNPGSPGGATDCGCGVSRSHHLPIICRRFAASRHERVVNNASSTPPLRTKQ